MSKRRKRPSRQGPRVYCSWLLIACAWLFVRLPLGTIISSGGLLGSIAFHLARSRRHIAHVNIALCFPELDAIAQRDLVRAIFRHAGIGLCESLIAWLNPRKRVAQHWTIVGIEHLQQAAAQGRGVLLVGAHFSCMDFVSQALAARVDLDVIYRANRNPAWEWLQVHGRRHYFGAVIERDDTRQILRRLQAGHTIWYAPDQDYGRKHSVFAPFFGVPAATITATARLARFNDSPVLFMRQHRHLATRRWEIEISPPLKNYPSGAAVADATRLNAVIEAAVRKDPAQYLWLHRRFKTRPPGEARPY